jgi:hypothetical protein
MKLLKADGCFARVDDEDFDELSRYVWHVKWRTKNHPYVFRYEKYKPIRLHRQIMGFPELSVDHINGDTLDNQKRNLRLATQQQQAMNTRRRNGKKYKGVTHCPLIHHRFVSKVPWRARIRVDGKLISLGFHATEEAAASAYNKAATLHFGEFACLNEVPQ